MLEGAADAASCDDVGRKRGDIAAAETDGATVRPDDTGDGIDQRCFAGAVRSDQAVDLAFLDTHGHAAHRGDATEADNDIVEGKEGHGSGALRSKRDKSEAARPTRPFGASNRAASKIAP